MEKIGYETGYKMWQKRCQTEKKKQTKLYRALMGKNHIKLI